MIRTNNVPRPVIYGYELSEKERAELDYLDWSNEMEGGFCSTFVRYKDWVYDLGDCMVIVDHQLPADSELKGWNGYWGESYFSAVLIKFCEDPDYVVMGQMLT
jgi:hypothetical protein